MRLRYWIKSGLQTFGLVIAEANAVGCPALLHGATGANLEIASSPDQCLDTLDPEAVVARLMAWRTAGPQVRMRREFRLASVAAVWRGLLAGQDVALPGEPGDAKPVGRRGIA